MNPLIEECLVILQNPDAGAAERELAANVIRTLARMAQPPIVVNPPATYPNPYPLTDPFRPNPIWTGPNTNPYRIVGPAIFN